jgi:hypothetical protein
MMSRNRITLERNAGYLRCHSNIHGNLLGAAWNEVAGHKATFWIRFLAYL